MSLGRRVQAVAVVAAGLAEKKRLDTPTLGDAGAVATLSNLADWKYFSELIDLGERMRVLSIRQAEAGEQVDTFEHLIEQCMEWT